MGYSAKFREIVIKIGAKFDEKTFKNSDVDMDAGTADHPGNRKLSQEADVESVGSGFSDAFSVFG